MKASICYFLLIFASFTWNAGISFHLNGGRLGDNILNYCKHKWISYVTHLDLFVPDFAYKNQLPLAKHEKSAENIPSTWQRKKIYHDSQVNPDAKNILYLGGYYTSICGIQDKNLWPEHIFKLSIEYPDFGHELKKMLTPTLETVPLPGNFTTVAIHIRKGGGFDLPLSSLQYSDNPPTKSDKKGADHYHPLKFPPEQYYLDQLLKLYNTLDQKDLYVYIFTDDKHPEKIMQRLQMRCPYKNILFDCRKEGNQHNKNVLYDIVMMSRFDYLIRSGSHYPLISQLIGNHKGIIYPRGSFWQNGMLEMSPIIFFQVDRIPNQLYEKTI